VLESLQHLKIKDEFSISCVCRANLIRSRVMESYLKRIFPEAQVNTFGYEAQEGEIPPKIISKIVSPWGLSVNISPSKNCSNNLELIEESKLVVAADFETRDYLLDLGIPSVLIQDFALRSEYIPSDPTDLDRKELTTNLAKVVHCTARLINFYFLNEKSKISSYESLEAIDSINSKWHSITIDSRLRNVDSKELMKLASEQVVFFTESDILSGEILDLASPNIRLYLPRYEIGSPEELLISEQWKFFVKSVSTYGDLLILTVPSEINAPESLFSSILAGRTLYD